MRAPASTRAKMSRPSSSSPNQCAGEGPSSRSGSCCEEGSTPMSGPKSAATTARITIAPPTLLIADPRIDHAVHEVREQVHANVGDGDEEDAALDERIVAEPD